MALILSPILESEVPLGTFAPSTRHFKGDSAFCVMQQGLNVVSISREHEDTFEIIELPLESVQAACIKVTSLDSFWCWLIPSTIDSDSYLYYWDGGWTLIGTIPGPGSSWDTAVSTSGGWQGLSSELDDEVYLASVVGPSVSGADTPTVLFRIFKATTSGVELVKQQEILLHDFSGGWLSARSSFADVVEEVDGILRIIVSVEDVEAEGGAYLKVYEWDKVNDIEETYSSNSVEYSFDVSAHPIIGDGESLKYSAVYSAPSPVPVKTTILEHQGSWTEVDSIPGAVQLVHWQGILLAVVHISGEAGITSYVGVVNSEGLFSEYPELTSYFDGSAVDAPFIFRLFPGTEFDGVLYATALDESGELSPYRIVGIVGPDTERRKVPMRSGPVSRIINLNSALLEQELSSLRDINGAVEGDLILDSNHYRMVGLALSAGETAIKIREE